MAIQNPGSPQACGPRDDDNNAQVDIYDPWIDPAEAEHEYGVMPLKDKQQANTYDAIFLAVAPPEFLQMGACNFHCAAPSRTLSAGDAPSGAGKRRLLKSQPI